MNSLRVRFIKLLIDLNEKIFFERKVMLLYKKIGSLNSVIDIGANKGQSIDLFLKINPKCEIYSIEANPTLYQLLIKKYRQNPNVHLFNVGISSSIGEKLFHENVLDYTSSFENLNMDSKYLEQKAKVLGVDKSAIISKTYNVHTLTLRKFIEENVRGEKIDLLKIDTEGHEFHCLGGLFSGDLKIVPDHIQIEQHVDDMYADSKTHQEIEALLNQNNYFESNSIKHGFGEFYEKFYSFKGKSA